MSRSTYTFAAVVAAVVLLALGAWFDGTVIQQARLDAAANFDSRGLGALLTAGSLVVAASCLLVGWLSWNASAPAGLVYLFLGGIFVALPLLFWNAPEPLAEPVSALFAARNLLNATGTIGGALLISGLVNLVRSRRGRSSGVAGLRFDGDRGGSG